jgi:sulfate transport system ATP-binding protein
MGFVGPVAELHGDLVRPHDVSVLDEPDGDATEAIVERVVRVGFEVRVELALGAGEPLTAQLTRAEAEHLELEPGQIVWVRADKITGCASPPRSTTPSEPLSSSLPPATAAG